MEGVDIILGNIFIGSRVWPDVPPAPIVTCSPVVSEPDHCEQMDPEVLSTCAVTHSMCKAQSNPLPSFQRGEAQVITRKAFPEENALRLLIAEQYGRLSF